MTKAKTKKIKPESVRLCRCLIGQIRGDCPFSYANGWHVQRAEMLLRIGVTPELTKQIKKLRGKFTSEDLEQLSYDLTRYEGSSNG